MMTFRAATAVLLLLGAVLRSIQYFANASLWLDEIVLSRNVLARDLPRLLLEPLDYRQVAPAGFLALQKLAVSVAGGNETGLRLVPWLCALAGLALFWRVAARFVSGAPLLMALGVFALTPTLIAHAGSVKQYSVDVAAVLALLFLALRFRERPSDLRRLTVAAAAGGAAILVSQPAVLAAGALGAVLALERRALPPPRPPATPLAILIASWGACALTMSALAFGTLSPETKDYMRSFWAAGFLPAPWAGAAAAWWVPRTLHDVLGHFAFFAPEISPILTAASTLLSLLAIMGLVTRALSRPWDAALLMAPILAALLASALHLLPVRHRVALWMGPLLLIAAGVGLDAAAKWLPARAGAAALSVMCALLLVPSILIVGIEAPPYRHQDIRPVLQRVAAERREGDAVYVYYGARHALAFYGPRVGLSDWTAGDCHRRDTRAYLRELDAFRGRERVWVIWTHAIPRFGEPEAIRSYLETIGVERLRFDAPSGTRGEGGAQALLYDLSDPGRLVRATAEAHALPPPELPDEGLDVGCSGPVDQT